MNGSRPQNAVSDAASAVVVEHLAHSSSEVSKQRQHLVGPALELPPDHLLTVPGMLLRVAKEHARAVALRNKELGVWREYTWLAVLERVRNIAMGLNALGVRKGDRVAIMGDPSPAWLLSDFAAQCLGAISYGLYPTSSPEEACFVLAHGGAVVLIAEDQEHVDVPAPGTVSRAHCG